MFGKNQENGPLAEKWQDRKSERTRLKNKRGDKKGESNDSTEISDRRKTSGIPGFPSGPPTRKAFYFATDENNRHALWLPWMLFTFTVTWFGGHYQILWPNLSQPQPVNDLGEKCTHIMPVTVRWKISRPVGIPDLPSILYEMVPAPFHMIVRKKTKKNLRVSAFAFCSPALQHAHARWHWVG